MKPHKDAVILKAMANGAVIEERMLPGFAVREGKEMSWYAPPLHMGSLMYEHRIALNQPADADGWIPWFRQAMCPPMHDDCRIEVRFRWDSPPIKLSVCEINWGDADIIAYRLAKKSIEPEITDIQQKLNAAKNALEEKERLITSLRTELAMAEQRIANVKAIVGEPE